MSSPHPTPAPLDLAQAESVLQRVADRDRDTDSPLPRAVDALLAECQRQRELLTEALRAWNHPTAESVNMRCRSMNAIRQHLSETEAK